MSMVSITLPDILWNSITQFLSDRDNAAYIATHRAARIILQCAPRQTELRISTGSEPLLYARYTNVEVDLNSCGRDAVTHIQGALALLFRLASSVKHLSVDMFVDGGYDSFPRTVSRAVAEIHLAFERGPMFPHVQSLNVVGVSGFTALHKFPALKYLRTAATEHIIIKVPVTLQKLHWYVDAWLQEEGDLPTIPDGCEITIHGQK